jgi:hypothetical protein
MSQKTNLRLWNTKILGKPGSLESVLESLSNMGFTISYIRVGHHVHELFANWQSYDQQVLDEINIAYEKRHLVFLISESRQDEYKYLQLWFELSWKRSEYGDLTHQQLYAYSEDTALFIQKKLHREFYAQRFLNVGTQMYNVLQPEFGWMERCPSRGYTKLQDVGSLKIPHIYWANFFGPSYVKKVGEEFLMDAPGWKKDSLDDGGILYVLAPHMGSVRKNNPLLESVKTYFQVDSVRRKTK